MIKKKISYSDFQAKEQKQLYLYDKYFNFFLQQYEKQLLPNKILLSGQAGIGKSTFAYHFINYLLSHNENYPYDYKNFSINSLNKSFQLVKQNCHPNFYLIENADLKQSIDVKQVKSMIDYVNKTTYNNNVKFILVNNCELLNLYSVNALLKVVEESSSNTYFIFIYNSSSRLVKTLKSRCIEFKISFTNTEKGEIFEKLLSYNKLDVNSTLFNSLYSYYDSPGFKLNLGQTIKEASFNLSTLNLEDLILYLIDLNIKNKSNNNLIMLQNCIELYYFNKLKVSNDKSITLFNYSKVMKNFNLFKTYNLDMNNTFFQIKENIIHG